MGTKEVMKLRTLLLFILFLIPKSTMALNLAKLGIQQATFSNLTQTSITCICTTHAAQQEITIAPQSNIVLSLSGTLREIDLASNISYQVVRRDSGWEIQLSIQGTENRSITYVDFKTAMGKHYNECYNATYGRYLTATSPLPAREFLLFLENLYEAYFPTKIAPSIDPIIPKVMHQIWLGSRLPDKFKQWQASWLKLHPTWQFILWTDQHGPHNSALVAQYPQNYHERSIQEIGNLMNQQQYMRAPNYGAKADILRLEILYRFGGVYLDVDTECFEPLDMLHHRYDFYAGIEPLEFLWLAINNGIIGSIPGHPILKEYIENISKQPAITTGVLQTHITTGPIAFSRAFWAQAGKNSRRDIAFPARYFGPIDRFEHITMWPETMICQYYSHSWIAPMKK